MASNSVDTAASAADAARSRVTATMDDIQHRLDPRRIVADAVDRVQTSSRALAVQAGDAAKAHPVAIGTAAAALALALLARNRLSKATVNLGDGTGDYTDYDDGYSEQLAYDAAPPRMQALVGEARETAIAARETAGANPGAAIVVGLLAGAILGALLPTSEVERRTLAETGGRLSAAARAAARAAADELEAAGLSVDSVRAKADEATRNARHAAHTVMDAARAELKG